MQITPDAIIVAIAAIYLTYTTFAGARDYKNLRAATDAAQRLRFFRKWGIELILLTLAGIAALFATGRGADLITFPQELAPVHDFLAQPIAAAIFWLLFAAFAYLMFAPPIRLALRAPNEGSAARAQKTLDAVPMLARNGRERAWGALMSLCAGAGEEIVFRLLLPLALFALTHSLIAALAIPIIAFGIGHAYQGPSGILMTGLVGALMLGVYAATQSLWFVALVHALVDLRAVVLLGWLLEKRARVAPVSA